MYQDMTSALAEQRRQDYRAQAAQARLAAGAARRPRIAKQLKRLRLHNPLFQPLYDLSVRPSGA